MINTYICSLNTLLNKEVSRIFRIWSQSLLPSVITSVLYFTIFGHFIGGRIGVVGDHPYMQFITPGLIMLAVITNSYANVVSSFYLARFQHNIEEILVSPTPNYIMLLGYVMGGVLRGILVGGLVTIIALFYTHLTIQHLWITLSMVILTALLFSLAGFTNAIYAKSFDDITIVPTFVLTPLTYLGGIFYSVDMLPEFWRHVSYANPILYMVNAFRYGILGASDIPLSWAYSIVISVIVALTMLNLYLLKKGTGIRT